MPTQSLWNLGPAPFDFYGALSGIGRTIGGGLERIGERQREDEQTRQAGQLMAQYLAAQQGQTPADQLLNLAGSAAPGAPPASRSLPSFARTEGGQPSQTIRGVIERAAAANEVSPEYLTRMVGVES